MKFFSFLLSFFVVLALLLPGSVKAANEFSTSYDTDYVVNEDGSTIVTEKIVLKNLTDKFFPSSFSLTLPDSEVSDIVARDAQGPLEFSTSQEGANTKLNVKFTNQQIIGLGKQYGFTLSFKDKKVARNLGKVWTVFIPKVNQDSEVENFKLTLSVPTTFGDPDFISPKPDATSESGGRVNFIYANKEPSESAISAIFGDNLSFNFNLNYELQSNSIFPKLIKVPVPGNSTYQKAFIENINPMPENTEIDALGNTVAIFKVNPGQTLNVNVSGVIQSFLNTQNREFLNSELTHEYSKSTKFWDTTNPAITTKLSEILNDKNLNNNIDKAREINRFVTGFLQFDSSRIEKNDFTRFGSVTALNNPEKSLATEFVDLEIALLRAANIPAKEVIGFSLGNESNRPMSFNGNLHTWVEFYDPDKGWLIADPAWGKTAGGADFFALNDLNHLGLAFANGATDFAWPSQVNVSLYDGEIAEKKGASLDVQVETKILSGFPSKAKIKIINLGNTTFPESELKVDSSKILIDGLGGNPAIAASIPTPEIPPFGNLEYDLNLKTGAIWHSYQDIFQVTFAGVTDTRVLTVEPILSYKIFMVEIIGGLIMIVLLYIATILLHHKSTRKHEAEKE